MTDNEIRSIELVLQHKESIAKYMAKFAAELSYRSAIHDVSKFKKEELEVYAEFIDEMNKHPFNSPEEKELREKYQTASIVHKKLNRHHPEHFENGMEGMNLIDLIEMLCDWRSASERSAGDSIRKGLPIMKDKYNISPQLLKILENTLKDFNLF